VPIRSERYGGRRFDENTALHAQSPRVDRPAARSGARLRRRRDTLIPFAVDRNLVHLDGKGRR
jgi:hypothetical protein